MSDEFYHTGIKENEGAFFKGDECEKIVKIFTVGASLLFAHTSEIAWIEWKTRYLFFNVDLMVLNLYNQENYYPKLGSDIQNY